MLQSLYPLSESRSSVSASPLLTYKSSRRKGGLCQDACKATLTEVATACHTQ